MKATPQDLQQLRQQRTALADRVRLPWWYLAAAAVMIAAVMATPFLAARISPEWSGWAWLVPVLVMTGFDRLLGRSTGIRLPRRLARTYPSVRPIRWVTLAIMLVACLGENLLLKHGHAAAAVVVIVVTAAVTTGILVRRTAVIRDDIAEGRATPR